MHNDSLEDAEPPPSYDEAINSNPVLPQRPTPSPAPSSSSSYHRPASARPSVPPLPHRPPAEPSLPSRPARPSSSSSSAASSTADLYTGNTSLPFRFPRGYFCQKCKNSGYKVKNGDICRDCWDKHFLRNNAYNPNPELPFRYPKRYLCDKCNNTGYKRKNGKTCKDCWEMFGPRNTYQSVGHTSVPAFGFTSSLMPRPAPYGGYGPPPMRVSPGDPRIGGILCGRCRGSGLVYGFLFDEDLCPSCQGLGRIINVPTSGPPGPPLPPAPPGPGYGRPPPGPPGPPGQGYGPPGGYPQGPPQVQGYYNGKN